MASDEGWTCGKGLAASAALPTKLAELTAARAEVLERHIEWYVAQRLAEPAGA